MGKKEKGKTKNAVKQMVAEGKPSKEIAYKLGISNHTVKNYLSILFEEYGVSNRTELTLKVLAESGRLETLKQLAAYDREIKI